MTIFVEQDKDKPGTSFSLSSASCAILLAASSYALLSDFEATFFLFSLSFFNNLCANSSLSCRSRFRSFSTYKKIREMLTKRVKTEGIRMLEESNIIYNLENKSGFANVFRFLNTGQIRIFVWLSDVFKYCFQCRPCV